MVIFREEALKLYNRLDEKAQENDMLRNRLRELEKDQLLNQQQEKEQMRSSKLEDMNKTLLESKLEEAQGQMEQQENEIKRLNNIIGSLREQATHRSKQELRQSSLMSSRRAAETTRAPTRRQPHDNEMKEWFLECVRTVKREVAMRNHSSTMLDLNSIISIEEFKTVDKLRLLELFLQNEKLLTWLYERIFPDRMAGLRNQVMSQRESNSRQDPEEIPSQQLEKRLLPRVNRVAVKSELRHSVVVRNGKLNISNL